jgi:hypothetical protein
MIVGFHLHQRVRQTHMPTVNTIRIRIQAACQRARHHRCIVVIRHNIARRVERVRIAYHFKQAHRLGFTINHKISVKNFGTDMVKYSVARKALKKLVLLIKDDLTSSI